MQESTAPETKKASEAEIAAHLRDWAYWYSRFKRIGRGDLLFASEAEREAAQTEAWQRWDHTFRWLEEQGIGDEHILYDEQSERATLKTETEIRQAG